MMHQVTVSRSTMGKSAIYSIARILAVESILPRWARADQMQKALAEAGGVCYEKYCTPCHGAGGTPGSAQFCSEPYHALIRKNLYRLWQGVQSRCAAPDVPPVGRVRGAEPLHPSPRARCGARAAS
jgi:hypothetical protein